MLHRRKKNLCFKSERDLRVPSTIRVYDFKGWVARNVPMATGVKAEGHTWIISRREDESNEIDNEAVDLSPLDAKTLILKLIISNH